MKRSSWVSSIDLSFVAVAALAVLAGCDDPPDEEVVGEPIPLYAPPSRDLVRPARVLGRAFLVPPGDGREAIALAIVGAGNELAIAGLGGSLEIWNLSTGESRPCAGLGASRVVALSTDGSGTWLGVSPLGGRPILAGPGGSLEPFAGPRTARPVWRVAIDPEGRRAAAATNLGGQVAIAPTSADEEPRLRSLETSLGDVAALALSSEHLAAADLRGQVFVLEVASGRKIDSFLIGAAPAAIAFAPGDVSRLAVLTAKGGIRLRDPVAARDVSFGAAPGIVRAFAWTGEGALVLGLASGILERRGIGDGEKIELARFGRSVRAVASLPAVGRIAAAGAGGRVRAWDGEREIRPNAPGHQGRVTSLAIASKGVRRLISGGSDGRVVAWHLEGRLDASLVRDAGPDASHVLGWRDGALVRMGAKSAFVDLSPAEPTLGALDEAPFEVAAAAGDRITACAFDEPGGRVVLGTADGRVELWDCARREKIAELEAHAGPVTAIGVGAHDLVVTAGEDGKVTIRDLARREILRELGRPGEPVRALGVSRSARLVAWVTPRGLVVSQTGEDPVRQSVPAQGARFTSLAFDPERGDLVAGADDGTIHVFEAMDESTAGWE